MPLVSWYTALTWLAMVAAVGYLMVSTWRFYSFKDIDFRSRHPFRLIILFGALVRRIWFFSRPVLFRIALLYMFSGVFWRLQWIFRRKRTSLHRLLQRGFADFMSSPIPKSYHQHPCRLRAAALTAPPSWAPAR